MFCKPSRKRPFVAPIYRAYLPPAAQTYQTWVRHGAQWTSLGTALLDVDGNACLIAESPALAVLPDEVEVTLEPRGGSTTPGAHAIVAWTR